MLLNSTLRLGYLEGAKDVDPKLQSTLKLDRPSTGTRRPSSSTQDRRPSIRVEERRPSTSIPPGSQKSPGQGSRKNSKDRSQRLISQDPGRDRPPGPLSREVSKNKETWQSLEWTYQPQKEVQKEGSVVYTVSTPATAGPRAHQPHLVRTTRIEPAAYSKKRPPIPPKKEQREQITVIEKDLLRCGSDLKKLRECNIVEQNVPERTLPAPLPPQPPLDLSFKSKFALDCREGADMRDPWKDLKHPDEDRVLTVEDLVLNQVYIKALLPRKIEFDEANSPENGRGRKTTKLRRSLSASTRASSADGRQTWPEEGARKWSTKRASSLGRADSFDDEMPILRLGSIQPISTETPRSHREDETPEAKRAARAFLQGAHKRGEMRAVWMALDRNTGAVQLYQQDAGTRLEAAFRSGRSSVPLAGLSPELEGAIVTFEKDDRTDKTLDVSGKVRQVDGTQAEVRRFEVTAYSYEMSVQVVGPSQGERSWRFACRGDQAEDRLVPLLGTELVSPPSPTLPPVSRTRPTYFINEGAHWGYE